MGLLSRIGRRGRAALLVAAGASLGAGAYVAADVPDSSGVIHACYQLSDPPPAPPHVTPGNVRIIDPSAGQACGNRGGTEVSLDWNFKGPTGVRGSQGPAGNTFTVATPTPKPTFSRVGVVVLGAGTSALRFGVLTSALHKTKTSSGKVEIKDMSITKTHDKASAALLNYAATGKHFHKATITMRKAGGSPIDYVKITLTDLIVTSVRSSPTSGGTPEETISFAFAKLGVEYKPQKPDGSLP